MTKYGAHHIMKEPSSQDGQKGALHKRQAVSPPSQGESCSPGKGGVLMVSYSELFQFVIILTSIAALFYQIGRNSGKRK